MASFLLPFRSHPSLSTSTFPFPRVFPSPHFPFTPRHLKPIGSVSMSQPEPENSINTAPKVETTAEDVVVQYVVLRRDLIDKWPLGSVVTQGCHASVAAIWSHKDDPHTIEYCNPKNIDSMHKVTLEVKGETQIRKLSETLSVAGISHKLWIEQPEDYPTCLATKPYPKSVVSSLFKKLKLCK